MDQNAVKAEDVKDIIKLYKKFSRYDKNSSLDILCHILPSLRLRQYKLHKDQGETFGFNNWAFLNEDAENRFKKTGKLKPVDWKSGDKLWHIDMICSKNLKKVMSWNKKYFTNKYGTGHPVSWLRLTEDNQVKRVNHKTMKENWK